MLTARTLLLIPLLVSSRLSAQQSFLPARNPGQSHEAPPAASQPLTTIRTTSRLVVLDVVVTDNTGKPVKGLQPSDFTLTEDGVKESLASFTEHDAGDDARLAKAAPTTPLPPDTFTVHPPLTEAQTSTVLVLDKIHYPNDPYVRADILKFLKTLAPGNPIAIVRLDWQGLHLVQDFTSDPQTLQEVVAGKRMLPALPSINCVHYSGVINPYGHLARYLAGIPGRINLAWVTDEGAPDSDPVQSFASDYPNLANFVANQYGSTDNLRLSRVVPYLIKAGGYIGGILQPDKTNIADIPIPQIIPDSHSDVPSDCELMPAAQGGLLANGILADKAVELGGHAFFNGATDALSQVIATGDDYYTLAYVPTNPDWNGHYRKIAIDVTGIPPTPASAFGAKDYGQSNITYRRGYYARSTPEPRTGPAIAAFTPDPASSPAGSTPAKLVAVPGANSHAASSMAAAMGFGALTPNQLDLTITVTPSPHTVAPKSGAVLPKNNFLDITYRDAPYRVYQVHYWIEPKDLKFSRTASGLFRDDLQFAAILYRDDGFVANSVSVTAHIQIPATGLEDIMASGVTFDQTLAVPVAGNFFLRTGVQETSTTRIGAIEVSTDRIQLPPPQTIAAAPKQSP
jgi:VWFA-related protein